MNLMQAIILGALQGFTEFLPISSSGHLVLMEQWLDLSIAPKDLQVVNILLHAGTLLALCMAYAPVWWRLALSPFTKDMQSMRQLGLLIVATVPGAAIGLLFEDWIAVHFQSLLCVGVAFSVTGVVLLLGERFAEQEPSLMKKLLHPFKSKKPEVTWSGAVLVGIAQALALVPGLSRSGLTVSTGRVLGLKRKDALDFSFLMATPIIAGATVMSLSDLFTGTVLLPELQVVAMAVAVSFLSSMIAIMFLRSFVTKRGLGWFAPYLFVVSAITIALHFTA